MESTSYVIGHFCAPNDKNGNPRRCFVLYRLDDGYATHVEARDEGYDGDGTETVLRHFAAHQGAERAAFLPKINVEPKEYRRLLAARVRVAP
jgi:hypothetical protein